MIEFEKIPSSIRKPGRYLEFNTSLAVRTLPANRQKMLIIAQRLAAGTVAALAPTAVFSDADAALYFGEGSTAHLMVRAAIKANPYLDLTVCAMDDSVGAVAAIGTITIANAATSSGYLRLYVGNHRVEIAIARNDAAAVVAAALNEELGKHPDLPVISEIAGAVLTLTARNTGPVGNQIDITAEVVAQGTTATVVPLANGFILPAPTAALAKVLSQQFDIIVMPYQGDFELNMLRDHLDLVSGPMEQRPGVGVFALDASLATATTLAAAIDSGRMVCAYLRGTKTPGYELAAAYAAVLASEEDPARPLNTLELKGVSVPDITQRLTRTEQEACLANGVAPLEVGPGERVQIVRAITTYLHNATGSDDISLLDVTTIRTLDYVRRALRERIALRFPRAKLSARTPGRVRAELLDVLKKLEELEIVEMVDDNKDGLIVERSGQDPNRLDSSIPADVVNGLHVYAARIDLLL